MYNLHLFQEEILRLSYILIWAAGKVPFCILNTTHTSDNTPCTHHITVYSLATELAQRIFYNRIQVFLLFCCFPVAL